MATTIQQTKFIMDNDRIEDDISDDEIYEAIQNSLKELKVSTGAAATTSSTSSPRSKTGSNPKTYSGNGSNTNTYGGSGSSQNRNQNAKNSPTKSGLSSVADVIHKNEDLSELSEAEQLELVMRESKIDALSPEEQYERAIRESLATVPEISEVVVAEQDDDITAALKLSMDPAQQENLEYRDHFQRLTSKNETEPEMEPFCLPEICPQPEVLRKPEIRSQQEVRPQPEVRPVPDVSIPEVVRGAEALPPEFRVPDLEDLEVENRSRPATKPKIKQPKNPPQTMSSRIAAKFPPKNDEFFNEDLFEANLQRALQASLADIKATGTNSRQPDQRSLSMSPTGGAGGAFLNGYSKVASNPITRSMTPPNTQRKTYLPYKPSRKGKFRPVVIDGCNVGWAFTNNVRFSAEGLKEVYECFKRKGYEDNEISIIYKHIPGKFLSDNDVAIIEFLEKINILVTSHARHAGNKLIRGDDDLYILQVAHEIDGIVLSNDQYRQYWDTQPIYREIIEKRLIQPLFVHNKLILPPDPLGKSGPKLEQFLRFDKD